MDPQMLPHMRQTRVLSQQARITIHVLQLPLMELSEFLEQEMWENPLLEDAKGGREEGSSKVETLESIVEGDPRPQRAGSYDDEDEEKRRYAETLITKEETLKDHLIWQMGMFLEGREYEIGEYIIGNIDDNGYLQVSLEDVEKRFDADRARVKEVLALIQTFDPAGVAARDLRECLEIQLRAQGREESLSYEIVDTSLRDLEKKDYPKMARKFNVDPDEVKEACDMINSLDPKPGRTYSPDKVACALPDVILKKEEERFTVEMNNKYLPSLITSKFYSKLLKDEKTDDVTREYLEKKRSRAEWVINAILQRQNTIKRVAEYVANFQKDFLEDARGKLKPLRLTDVAKELSLSESTISRTVAHKYIQTEEGGTLPLKRFFSTGLKQENGEAVSSDLIKSKIRDMIDKEDPQKPLSDHKISDVLKKDEINVARRTVAKYRESMKILPAHLRKR